MEVYAAIDLHASNSFLAVVDPEDKRVFKRRLVNDSAILLMGDLLSENTAKWGDAAITPAAQA